MRSDRRLRVVLDLWVAGVTFLLTWPLWVSGGYPLARDLVFTPHIPFRPETLGLGTGSPRAAPLDAVVSLLGVVVDGAVLARVLVPGALLLAGWGAHRLLGRLPVGGRGVAATLAVWNPFVIERLALGQWALLLAYGALWWLVATLARGGGAGAAAPWVGVAALTPTGALLALVTIGTFVVGRAPQRSRRSTMGVLGLGLLVQLPWIVPALLSRATVTSAAAGVELFAARSERPGPAYLSLLGLGGIWDSLSVPASRSGLLGYVTSAVVGLSVAWWGLRGRQRGGPPGGGRLLVLGLVAFVAAGLSSVPVVADGVASLMTWVPGLGLVRDGQKLLIPFVLLAVVACAEASTALVAAARAHSRDGAMLVAGLLWVGPLLLLPDATRVVHPTLQPVSYPVEVEQVRSVVEAGEGAVAVLPWSAYQRLGWAGPGTVYDPSSRLFDARVVTSDALRVGAVTVPGEDPYAGRVGSVLEVPGERPEALADLGVRWVLIHRSTTGAEDLRVALVAEGAREVLVGRWFVVLQSAEVTAGPPRPPELQVVGLAVLDAAVLAVLLVLAGWSRRRPKGPGRGLRNVPEEGAPSVTLA